MSLTDNLVSYWKLDESSGNAADSVGSNTLTNNNTVTYSTGKINNGAVITGSTQSLSITDAAQTGLDFTGDMSWSFWWKTPTLGSSYYGFFNKFVATGNQRAYRFYYDRSGAGIFEFDMTSNGTSADAPTWTYTLSSTTWYHVVITYTASTSKYNLYINGSAQAEKSGSQTSIYNSSAALYIGNDVGGSNQCNLIDEIACWSRVLTSAEVTSLYNGGNGLQYPFAAGPTNLKSYNTNLKANIKSINTNLIANVKSLNTNT